MPGKWHLACYYGSITNGVANSRVPAVNDGQLTITNQSYVLPQRGRVSWIAGFGVDLDRIRINTPKYRYVGLPSGLGVNKSLTVPSPLSIADWSRYPLVVDPVDEISAEVTQSGAGAAVQIVAAGFTFNQVAIAEAPVFWIRGTAAISYAGGDAGTWKNGSITLDSTLPQGRYELVGMDCQGTNLIAARMIYPGSGYRPGTIGRNTLGQVRSPIFDPGSLGQWGDFTSINLPNLEILCSGACSSQEVYLAIQRLGNDVGGIA